MKADATTTPTPASLAARLGHRASGAIWRRARSGNGLWLAAAFVASGLRLLVRWSRREREVVYRSELAPGEQLAIRVVSPTGDRDAHASEQG
ncbi:hypothetical protein [Candidatus Poriferisodalis sp.]|uniref:hypothetical protein n=1 Tax=Candidatus Poriferisodalis sp. TaxID=3101277 RepID=UPI003B02C5AD